MLTAAPPCCHKFYNAGIKTLPSHSQLRNEKGNTENDQKLQVSPNSKMTVSWSWQWVYNMKILNIYFVHLVTKIQISNQTCVFECHLWLNWQPQIHFQLQTLTCFGGGVSYRHLGSQSPDQSPQLHLHQAGVDLGWFPIEQLGKGLVKAYKGSRQWVAVPVVLSEPFTATANRWWYITCGGNWIQGTY